MLGNNSRTYPGANSLGRRGDFDFGDDTVRLAHYVCVWYEEKFEKKSCEGTKFQQIYMFLVKIVQLRLETKSMGGLAEAYKAGQQSPLPRCVAT